MDSKRKNIHLINDLPHIYELEDLMAFCGEHKQIYIYGRGEEQEYLLKYLDMCGVAVGGYVVSFLREQEPPFLYRPMPLRRAEEVLGMEGAGIILALPDRHYGKIIPMFREAGFKDYFVMSEHSKRGIAQQMRPRTQEEMTFEVSLADHCNLSCQMCDHYSQLSEEWFVGMEQFERDMVRMGELYNHKVGAITLLGGEPTLHRDIVECIRVTRREFPEGEVIILTNGVLLLALEHSEKGNFWEACREYDVHVSVTVYPIKLDYQAIEAKGKEYGVPVFMSSNIHADQCTRCDKVSDKHVMDLEGRVERFYCVNCLYFNKFNVLKDGRLYMCPVAAHSDIFNRAFGQELELEKRDFLDIYEIGSWEEIAEFACSYTPFCRYCDLKHWGPHSRWKASSRKMEEYV